MSKQKEKNERQVQVSYDDSGPTPVINIQIKLVLVKEEIEETNNYKEVESDNLEQCVKCTTKRVQRFLEKSPQQAYKYVQQMKAYRKLHGLSQDKFANKIGVSGRAIAYYETGKNIPQPQFAQKIEELLQKEGLI